MRTYDLFVVVTLTFFTASCGNSSHQLQSLTITPAAADTAGLSSPVQFKAVGTFTDGHKAQVAAQWTLTPFCPFGAPCPPETIPAPGWIKLSNLGVAQCTASGPPWTIYAAAAADTNIAPSQIILNTKFVSATAQITCTQATS